ncbi:MAG: hypothetical protein PHQ86_01810 [Dehalococcoidales bacterium]|nr:hypothetical protein [Dehalococcoidales bacterium]
MTITAPHVHHVTIRHWVEPYIESGTCECGEILFYPTEELPVTICGQNKVFNRCEELYRLANHTPQNNIPQKEVNFEQLVGSQTKTPQRGGAKGQGKSDEKKNSGATKEEIMTPITEENTESVGDRQQLPKKKGKSKYDVHKDEILADIESMGFREAMAKWKISQASWLIRRKSGYIDGISVRWGVADKYPWQLKTKTHRVAQHGNKNAVKNDTADQEFETRLKEAVTSPPVGILVINRHMPAYPDFSQCKDEGVQMEWLTGYIGLVKMSRTVAPAGDGA